MTLVVASAEISGGNVLSFNIFPTQPHPLSFTITFHVEGEVNGEIAYAARKWGDVICQTDPMPLQLPYTDGRRQFSHTDHIDVAFPGQGPYVLDIFVDGSLVHSLPFSVFDNSRRADIEREIIYYLKAKRGARSVLEITRGVFNPAMLNKANIREMSGKVYFALLRMKEVTNVKPVQQGSLEDRMDHSRWQLKE